MENVAKLFKLSKDYINKIKTKRASKKELIKWKITQNKLLKIVVEEEMNNYIKEDNILIHNCPNILINDNIITLQPYEALPFFMSD